MSDVRFEVKTDLAVLNQITLEANFEQLDESLELMMADYQNMVVTPESLVLAKSERAKIRKTIEQIEDARKTVARIYKKPLERFEARVKQSLMVCNEAADHLDGQIKFIISEEARQKVDSLKGYFEENRGESLAWLEFSAIRNPKWKNTTFKAEDARKEIDAEIAKIASDLETIRGLRSEFEIELISDYKASLNLSAAIRKNNKLAQMKREEEERKAAEEIRLKAKEEADRKTKEALADRASSELGEKTSLSKQLQEIREEERNAVAHLERTEPEEEEQSKFDVLLRVEVTANQLKNLVEFLRGDNIKFSRVKETDTEE